MAQTSRSSIFVLVPLLLAFVVLLIPRSTSAQHLWGYHCPNTTMFANNSQYETNLNAVFHSLSSNATNPSGYAQAVARNGSNEAIYGHFLCRGDQPAASCRDCLVTATTNDLPRIRCPNRKVAIIWYDECMVRYSNESFFRRMDADPWFPLTNEKNITGNITQFMDAVGNMMNDLRVRTSNGGPQKKYAADASKYSSLVTQYGLAQCTPDISASQCNKCLSIAIGMLATSIGARAVMPSCNVRYEIDPFFEGATDISLPPSSSLPSPPSMSSPDGKKKVSTKGILAIVVPLAATSLFMLCIWICYRKRKSKSKFEPIENGEELITVESLQYGLSTLQVATNNFSDENKLGDGGFGSVYKDLLSYAWKQWIAGTPLEFVDATIRGSCSLDEVVRCMNLGFLCVQESIDDRPTTATIVLMLESQSLTLTAPKEPTLCGKSSIFSKHVESDQSNNKSILGFVNDVSITEMEPR
ncbi:hypothetical protein BVRB_8g187080 [Beta vulgaris subsp. vulgaris]|nr:hypothetical protein BVRB_8g187080 [Beta vulgaris subsp. vulgaris]